MLNKSIKISLFILIALAVLLVTTPSNGADCRQVSYPYRKPIVHEQVTYPPIVKDYVNTIAVPILVPAYQFQYSAPQVIIQQQAIPQEFQPQAMPQVAVPQGGVQANQQMPNYSQGHDNKIKELAKALLEEMSKQQEVDNGPPAVNDPNAPKNEVPSKPNSPVQNSGPPGINQSVGMSPEEAAPIAINAIKQNCAACHTGIGAKGDFVLFNNPDVFNAGVSWRSIAKEIGSGRMPPRSSQFRLTEQQKQAIAAWLQKNS